MYMHVYAYRFVFYLQNYTNHTLYFIDNYVIYILYIYISKTMQVWLLMQVLEVIKPPEGMHVRHRKSSNSKRIPF